MHAAYCVEGARASGGGGGGGQAAGVNDSPQKLILVRKKPGPKKPRTTG